MQLKNITEKPGDKKYLNEEKDRHQREQNSRKRGRFAQCKKEISESSINMVVCSSDEEPFFGDVKGHPKEITFQILR